MCQQCCYELIDLVLFPKKQPRHGWKLFGSRLMTAWWMLDNEMAKL